MHPLQRNACCSVLQCVAVCCSVLQCVAVCCSVLQCATSASHMSHLPATCQCYASITQKCGTHTVSWQLKDVQIHIHMYAHMNFYIQTHPNTSKISCSSKLVAQINPRVVHGVQNPPLRSLWHRYNRITALRIGGFCDLEDIHTWYRFKLKKKKFPMQFCNARYHGIFCEVVMSHIWKWVMSHIWMSHVPHMKNFQCNFATQDTTESFAKLCDFQDVEIWRIYIHMVQIQLQQKFPCKFAI